MPNRNTPNVNIKKELVNGPTSYVTVLLLMEAGKLLFSLHIVCMAKVKY